MPHSTLCRALGRPQVSPAGLALGAEAYGGQLLRWAVPGHPTKKHISQLPLQLQRGPAKTELTGLYVDSGRDATDMPADRLRAVLSLCSCQCGVFR